jgi:hypothetical protein
MVQGKALFIFASCFTMQWTNTPGTLASISKTWESDSKFKFGFIAWGSLVLMACTSLPYIRRYWFEVFKYSHYLFIVFFVFAFLHTPEQFLPYVCVVIVMYGVDKALRCIWGLLPKYTIGVDVRHKGIVKVAFPKNKIHQKLGLYRPGQYVSIKAIRFIV